MEIEQPRYEVSPMDEIILRPVSPQDAKNLLAIYAPYVENTAITFEYDVPSLEEFTERITRTLQNYPYLAAESVHTRQILGYAYAGPFHARAAYAWTAEVSIYLHPSARKQGIGRRLYEALEYLLQAQNILNLYSCIAYPSVADEYLDKNSVQFHTHMGYHLAGEFQNCGYKFHRWYHMVWMEKLLGTHTPSPKPIKSAKELPIEELLQEISQRT